MRKFPGTKKRRNAKARSNIHFEPIEPRLLLSGEVNPTAMMVEGEISAPGEKDQFEFVVEETRRVVFDSLTNRSDLNWTLEGPSGQISSSSFYSNGSISSVFELTEGNYRVTVDGKDDAVGEYSMRVIDANAAVDLIPGEEVQGTLEAGGSAAVYRFAATAGEQFYFKPGGVSGGYYASSARWHLIDPYGRTEGNDFALSSTRDTFSVQRSGEYLLVVDGYLYNTSPVNYRFTLSPVVDSTKSLTLDEVTSATIAQVGQVAKFRFQLTEATPVLFERLGDTNFYWSLNGPDGLKVSRMSADSGASSYGGGSLGWLLLAAGDYELTIDPHALDATGAWPFRLLTRASAQTLETGALTTATLGASRGTTLYRLDLTEGDRFRIDGRSLTGGALTWRLLDRYGVQIDSSALLTPRDPFLVDVSGEYWLVLEGSASNAIGATLDYSFAVSKMTDVAATLAVGDRVTGCVEALGQSVIYSFELAAATQLAFDAQTNRSDLTWSLMGPRGVEITKRRFDQSDASILSVLGLLPPGQYRLAVQGSGVTTGDYAFRLIDLATAPILALDTALSGVLAPGNSTQAWRFEVAAGDKVAFQSNEVTGGNATWRLIDRFGRDVLGANSLATNQEAATLVTGGVYTLLVEGHPDAVETITFNVQLNAAGNEAPVPLPEGDPLNLGVVVSGETSGTEKKVWNFTLATDSMLVMDQLLDSTSYLTRWSLSGPRGVEVNRRYLDYSDANYNYPVLDLPAGDYALTIENGAYAFRLLDATEFPYLALGQQDTVVRSPGNSTLGFRFDGTKNETLVLNWSDSSSRSMWTLVDPYGRKVSSFTGNDVGTSWTLPVTGTYVLLNESYYNYSTSTNVSFRLGAQEHSVCPLVFNEQVEGTFEGAQGLAEYQFTLEERATIVFDALTAGNVQWMLKKTKGGTTVQGWTSLDTSTYPHTLSPGQYSLFVRGSRDAAATYKFQVLNREAATNLVPGTAVNDSFPVGEAHLYRFNATAGERFYFDGQASSSYNHWRLLDPYDRTIIVSNYMSSDYPDIALETTGEYLLLAYNYNSYAQGEALTARFNLVSRRNSTETLTLNEETSGKFEQPGAVKYNFTLSAPTQILVEGLAGSGITWRLDGPRGNEANGVALDGDTPLFGLPAGNYALTLTSNSLDSIPFCLRVTDMSAVPALEVDAETILSRAPDEYFNAYRRVESTGMEQVLLESLESASPARWELYDASGKLRAEGNTHANTLLPNLAAGRYFLVLDGATSWRVALRKATRKDAPLALSSLVSDRLDRPGQENHYTFAVTGPTPLLFEGLTSGNALRWELSGPNGVVRDASGFFDMNGASIRLDAAGTYVLRVFSASHVAADFGFRLLDLSALPAVPLAGRQSVILDAGRRTQVFAFDSVPWDVFNYRFNTISENAPSASLYLLDAEGRILKTGDARYDNSKDLGAMAGRHYLVLQANAGATSGVILDFTAQWIQDQLRELAIGENVQGYLGSGVLEDTWRFGLSTDQRLVLNGFPSNDLFAWELMDDTGRIFIYSALWKGAPALLDLKAGNYRIVIRGRAGDDTSVPGRYGFQLVDVSTAGMLTTGVAASGVLPAPAGADVYRFRAQANESWYVGGQGCAVTVFDPRGEIVREVFQGSVFFDSGALSGDYLVVVSSSSLLTDDLAYTVTVAHAVEYVERITIGDILVDEIAAPYEARSHRFSLATATRLWIVPGKGNDGMRWRVVPVGTRLGQQGYWRSWNSNDIQSQWLEAGDYVLAVACDNPEGGAYQIQLL
ncbi:MAG: LEPR-XLL domain-containing protein, partial [Zoogloeaceae bacterium]|nr:LEPR-XLL domain-containing protein [Zoogloeaceae bacterium]